MITPSEVPIAPSSKLVYLKLPCVECWICSSRSEAVRSSAGSPECHPTTDGPSVVFPSEPCLYRGTSTRSHALISWLTCDVHRRNKVIPSCAQALNQYPAREIHTTKVSPPYCLLKAATKDWIEDWRYAWILHGTAGLWFQPLIYGWARASGKAVSCTSRSTSKGSICSRSCWGPDSFKVALFVLPLSSCTAFQDLGVETLG